MTSSGQEKCLAGQRDIAVNIGTVPLDVGQLTGMGKFCDFKAGHENNKNWHGTDHMHQMYTGKLS